MPTFTLSRIKEVAAERGISVRQLSKAAGISSSTIGEMVKNNSGGIVNIQKIANILKVDISEFVTFDDVFENSLKRDKESIDEAIRIIRNISDEIEKSGINSIAPPESLIPLISLNMMGKKTLSELLNEGAGKKFLIPNVTDADFLLPITGYSMEGDFNPGDILICKYMKIPERIEYGRAFAIETKTKTGFIIRRVMPSEDENSIQCTSPNKNFPAFDISMDDVISFSLILGKIRLE